MRLITVVFVGLAAIACQPVTPPPAAPPMPRPIAHDAADAVVASSDGVPIRYHAEGRGEPALVFIHGWSCDRHHWDEQVQRFSTQREVITLDLAGHGDSGKERKDWTLASLGEDVRAVLVALDVRRAVLIGHSMGGPVALEAASTMPDRVIAVIGVDTFHNVERHATTAQTDALIARWQGDYAATSKLFVDSLLPSQCDAAIRDRLQAQFAAADRDIALALLRTLFDYDTAAAFARVHVPIRAINTSLTSDAAAGQRHHADFAIVDLAPLQLGHFPMLTAPTLFDAKLADTLTALGVPTTAPTPAPGK
jgi:pimeloyl-ACP methyl ester carboxylesterase